MLHPALRRSLWGVTKDTKQQLVALVRAQTAGEELVGVEDEGQAVIVVRPPHKEATIPHLPEPEAPWITQKQ